MTLMLRQLIARNHRNAAHVVTTTPYTLQASDAGKTVQVNLSGQSLIYADASVFAADDVVTIENTGGGQTSVLGLPRPPVGDFLLIGAMQNSTAAMTAYPESEPNSIPSVSVDGANSSSGPVWAGALYHWWSGTEDIYDWPEVQSNADSATITQALGGVDSVNPVNASGFTPTNSGGSGTQSYTANGITTTAGNCMLAYILAVKPNAEMDAEPVFTPPAGFTNPIVARFLQSGGESILCMAFKAQSSAGATGNASGSLNLGVTINAGVAGLVAIKGASAMPTLKNFGSVCDNSNVGANWYIPVGTKLTGDRLPVVADAAGSVTLTVTDDHTIAAASAASLPSIHLTPAMMDSYVQESNGTWTDPVATQASGSTFLQFACSRFGISAAIHDNKANTYTNETLVPTADAGLAVGYALEGTGGAGHRGFIQSGDDNHGHFFEIVGAATFVGRQFTNITARASSLNSGTLALQAGDLAFGFFYGDVSNGTTATMGLPHATQHPTLFEPAWVGNGMTAVSAFVVPADGNYSETFEFPGTAAIENAGATAVIMAFRPAVPPPPSIALATNLPTLLHVGDVVNATITATLVGGATGPVTITATPLPAGLSLGSVTDNGDGIYTRPVTGTVTTEQTVDVAINATNGTLNATELDVSVTVTAATGALPILSGHSAVNPAARVSSISFPIPAGASAGDYALILVSWDNTTTPTTPTGWTLIKSGTSTADGQLAALYGKELAAGDLGTTVTVALDSSHWACGTIETWSGVDAANVTATVNTYSSNLPTPVSMVALGSAVASNTVTIGCWCKDSTDNSGGAAYALPAPSGWTLLDQPHDGAYWCATVTAYVNNTTARTVPDTTTTDTQNPGGWIAFQVNLPPA